MYSGVLLFWWSSPRNNPKKGGGQSIAYRIVFCRTAEAKTIQVENKDGSNLQQSPAIATNAGALIEKLVVRDLRCCYLFLRRL